MPGRPAAAAAASGPHLEAVLLKLHTRVGRSLSRVAGARARCGILAALLATTALSMVSVAYLHTQYITRLPGPPLCIVARVAGALEAAGAVGGATGDASSPVVFKLRVLPAGLAPATLAQLRETIALHLAADDAGGEGAGGEGAAAATAAAAAAAGAPSELSRLVERYMRRRLDAERQARVRAGHGASSPGAHAPLGAAPSPGAAPPASRAWRVEAELSALLSQLPSSGVGGSAAAAHPLSDPDGALAPLLGGGAFVDVLRRWIAPAPPALSTEQDGGGSDAALNRRRAPAPPPPAAHSHAYAKATGLRAHHAYSYAFDRGLLGLSARLRDALGVRLLALDVAADDPCLGDAPARLLLSGVAGYDTAVLNVLLQATRGAGFVQVGATGATHALSHAHDVPRVAEHGLGAYGLFKLGAFCSALFLMFAVSHLVSFILAHTQQRMLQFTLDLQRTVRSRRPLLPLVGAHLLESLAFVPLMLGVLFFLFEFYGDQLLAFLMTLLVWACELWSVVTCRTDGSLALFPKAFSATMVLYHVYFLTYPFGFKYAALGCAALCLAAVAFACWHLHELPALAAGVVSRGQPRMPAVAAVLSLRAFHVPFQAGGGGEDASAQPGGMAADAAAAAMALAGVGTGPPHASGGDGRAAALSLGGGLEPGGVGALAAIASLLAEQQQQQQQRGGHPASPVASAVAAASVAGPDVYGSPYRPFAGSSGVSYPDSRRRTGSGGGGGTAPFTVAAAPPSSLAAMAAAGTPAAAPAPAAAASGAPTSSAASGAALLPPSFSVVASPGRHLGRLSEEEERLMASQLRRRHASSASSFDLALALAGGPPELHRVGSAGLLRRRASSITGASSEAVER